MGHAKLLLLLVRLLLIACCVVFDGIHGSLEEERLIRDLFKGYNKLIRPVKNANDQVVVEMDLTLIQLIDVVEKEQIMKTNVWIVLRWKDFQLNFQSNDYNLGPSAITVPSEKVWTPDIVLFNNADGNYEASYKSNALIQPDRDDENSTNVEWMPPAIYKSSCTIDVKYFPFDEQTCLMRFGSWTFDAQQVKLRRAKPMVNLADYLVSGTWDIISAPAEIEYMNETNRMELVYKLKIRRKTLFYTVNLIIPTVLISFLSLFVFYLPTDEGEKMTLCISILLALVVFLLLVSKILPPTSMVIPLISKYLIFTLMMNIVTIFNTVIIINWNYRTPRTHTMPAWVRVVFIDFLPVILFMKRPDPNEGRAKRRTREQELVIDGLYPSSMQPPPPPPPHKNHKNAASPSRADTPTRQHNRIIHKSSTMPSTTTTTTTTYTSNAAVSPGAYGMIHDLEQPSCLPSSHYQQQQHHHHHHHHNQHDPFTHLADGSLKHQYSLHHQQQLPPAHQQRILFASNNNNNNTNTTTTVSSGASSRKMVKLRSAIDNVETTYAGEYSLAAAAAAIKSQQQQLKYAKNVAKNMKRKHQQKAIEKLLANNVAASRNNNNTNTNNNTNVCLASDFVDRGGEPSHFGNKSKFSTNNEFNTNTNNNNNNNNNNNYNNVSSESDSTLTFRSPAFARDGQSGTRNYRVKKLTRRADTLKTSMMQASTLPSPPQPLPLPLPGLRMPPKPYKFSSEVFETADKVTYITNHIKRENDYEEVSFCFYHLICTIIITNSIINHIHVCSFMHRFVTIGSMWRW